MLKKLLILVFIVSMVTQWKLVWGEDFNFRYTKWGMTKEEVFASEEMDPIEKNGDMIKYKTQILGKNVELLYLFVGNKLIGASYKLDENYLNSDHFIKAYTQFKEALMKKYGQPNREITNWINDTYKNVRKKWGLALSLGHIEYAALWKIQSSTIECSLRGENYNILCLVKYSSTEYSHLSEETKKKDTLDPL